MSFDLKSDSGAELTCGSSTWDFYCWLADDYGWQRAGTIAPQGVPAHDWNGGYSSCDGQRVTPEDAAQLATALDRSLHDPERAVRQREVIRRLNAEVRRMALELEGVELPDESNSEPLPEDRDLDELIRFLRQGGFRIE